MSFVIGKIRDELGIAVAGLSFGAGFVIYLVLFMLLMATLPRGTTDPGAILPGAALVAAVFVGLQAVSQLYIPNRISGASDLYGGIGVAVVALGWLFIVGRTLVVRVQRQRRTVRPIRQPVAGHLLAARPAAPAAQVRGAALVLRAGRRRPLGSGPTASRCRTTRRC